MQLERHWCFRGAIDQQSAIYALTRESESPSILVQGWILSFIVRAALPPLVFFGIELLGLSVHGQIIFDSFEYFVG
jgi:hypothetical protein